MCALFIFIFLNLIKLNYNYWTSDIFIKNNTSFWTALNTFSDRYKETRPPLRQS